MEVYCSQHHYSGDPFHVFCGSYQVCEQHLYVFSDDIPDQNICHKVDTDMAFHQYVF